MKTKLFATLAIGAIAAVMMVGCDPKPAENDTVTPPSKSDAVTKAPTPPANVDPTIPNPPVSAKPVPGAPAKGDAKPVPDKK